MCFLMHKITVDSSKGRGTGVKENPIIHIVIILHINERIHTSKTSRLPFLKNQNKPKTPCRHFLTPKQITLLHIKLKQYGSKRFR